MWQEYYSVNNINDALNILAEKGDKARIVAGGTDLILELERNIRTGIESLVDISRIQGLNIIHLDQDGLIHLGPLVTHNQCASSKLIVDKAFPLAKAAWEVGAPQIRNRGTIAGNVITASPANDTITPLMALDAQVKLKTKNGERVVPLSGFYSGVRKTVMQPEEMLVDIFFKAMKSNQAGTFIKVGLRKVQAIAVVNAAMIVTFSGEKPLIRQRSPITDARITLGAVAPTIIRAHHAESYLNKSTLSENVIAQTAERATREAKPIDDIRGSAAYRNAMVRVCIKRGLEAISRSEERLGFPLNPVLLKSPKSINNNHGLNRSIRHDVSGTIKTNINGKDYKFKTSNSKTLLRLLREDAGLIGTKEGCAEGECGACTVYLDGEAVMSCLVPAVRAHQAEIVTIEGIAESNNLHIVQQAFMDEGAVQCGYCTPGFIMSGVKLLEEKSQPTKDEILQAISGNLCRCTGYYSIINAIEKAANVI